MFIMCSPFYKWWSCMANGWRSRRVATRNQRHRMFFSFCAPCMFFPLSHMVHVDLAAWWFCFPYCISTCIYINLCIFIIYFITEYFIQDFCLHPQVMFGGGTRTTHQPNPVWFSGGQINSGPIILHKETYRCLRTR